MSIEFELKVSPRDMSRFLLRFNYTRLSGILGVLLGLASLAGLAVRWGGWSVNQRFLLILIAFLFLVFQPLTLLRKGKVQAKRTEMQDKLICHIDEQQISVSQGEKISGCAWDNVRKIVFGKEVIYVFTTTIHATIITKESCGSDFDELAKFLKEKKRR